MLDHSNSYWHDNGKHQAGLNLLNKLNLVPAIGVAPSEAGELLRHAENLYYELFNNGIGCNVERVESCVEGLNKFTPSLAGLVNKFNDLYQAANGLDDDDDDYDYHDELVEDKLSEDDEKAIYDALELVMDAAIIEAVNLFEK